RSGGAALLRRPGVPARSAAGGAARGRGDQSAALLGARAAAPDPAPRRHDREAPAPARVPGRPPVPGRHRTAAAAALPMVPLPMVVGGIDLVGHVAGTDRDRYR